MDGPSLGGAKFFGTYIILRPILHKLAIVILGQQFKTFDSNHFTLSCFNDLFRKCMAHKKKLCVLSTFPYIQSFP